MIDRWVVLSSEEKAALIQVAGNVFVLETHRVQTQGGDRPPLADRVEFAAEQAVALRAQVRQLMTPDPE